MKWNNISLQLCYLFPSLRLSLGQPFGHASVPQMHMHHEPMTVRSYARRSLLLSAQMMQMHDGLSMSRAFGNSTKKVFMSGCFTQKSLIALFALPFLFASLGMFGWPFDLATISQSPVSQRSADHRFHFKHLNMRRVSLWEGVSSWWVFVFVSLRTGKKSKVLMGLSKSEENIMEALEDSSSNLAAADVILCVHVWVFHIKHLWMCYNTSSACGPPNRLYDMSWMCWPSQHGQAIADDKGPTARVLSIWGMGVKIFQMLEVGRD